MRARAGTTGHPVRRGLFFGWWIAWAGCWLYFLNALAFTYGYSLFVEPWSQEFGWSRSAISAVWSATLGVGLISALPAGWAIDRWGPRRVALVSVPLVAAGWFLITFVGDYWAFFVLFAGFVGLGIQPALVMAGQAAVTRWFRERRSQAFAVLSAGAGLAGLVGVPLLSGLLAGGDWRVAARVLAATVLVLGCGLSLVLRPDPESSGDVPDGGPARSGRTLVPARLRRWAAGGRRRLPAQLRRSPFPESYTPAEARASRAFWLLMLIYISRFVGMGVVTLHLVPYLQQQGFSAAVAGGALGLGLAASLPGRAVFGWAADQIATRWVLAVSLVLQALSLVPVIFAWGQAALYLYALLWGFGLGSESLIHSMRAEHFGHRYFGTISGYFTWPQMIGRMAGAFLGGLVFDQLGGYLPAFALAAALFAVSAASAIVTGRPVPPRFGREPATDRVRVPQGSA